MNNPKDPNIEDVYSEQAVSCTNFATHSFNWLYIEQPAISKLLPDLYKQGMAILDAGCGSGRTIEYLISKGANARNITGIDLSEEMLEIAKKSLPNIQLIHSKLSTATIPNDSFDLITCIMVVHYLNKKEFEKTLENFYMWLKTKGTVILLDSHPTKITSKDLSEYFHRDWKQISTPWRTTIPFFHRTIGDYINSFIKAGFTIEAFEEPVVIQEGKAADISEYNSYMKCPSRIIIKARKL